MKTLHSCTSFSTVVTLRQGSSSEVTRSHSLRLSVHMGMDPSCKVWPKSPHNQTSILLSQYSSTFPALTNAVLPFPYPIRLLPKRCFLSYSLPPSTGSSFSLPSDESYYFSFSELADTLSHFTHCQDTDLLVCLHHDASYCYAHVNRLLQTFSHSTPHALQDLLMLN